MVYHFSRPTAEYTHLNMIIRKLFYKRDILTPVLDPNKDFLTIKPLLYLFKDVDTTF